MSETGAPVIHIEGLEKQLGRPGAGFRLRVPQLTVPKGALLAVTGKSGSGKSTLLDILSLIAAPTECAVFRLSLRDGPADIRRHWSRHDDRALSGIRRRSLGYVLQNGGLLRFLPVAGNLDLPVRMNRLPGLRQRRAKALADLDMADKARASVRSLSGGERQRIAILRAMAHGPDLVLADEPTGALDYAAARKVLALLAEAAARHGTTVVMVTHDTDLADAHATHRLHVQPVRVRGGDTTFEAGMA